MRFLALILALGALACADRDANAPSTAAPDPHAPLSVYVVSYPLLYFAERIGGEQVRVTFPAPPDADPALWSPPPDTVAAYQQADRVLLNGAGYAQWIARASLPRAALVDTSAQFRERWIERASAVRHTHGPEGDHSHRGWARAMWLDPTLATLQAGSVANAFAQARPQHEAQFREGLAALTALLSALDDRLASAAAALDGAPLLFSHPVYDYLIRRYELNARFVHWEPDEPPTLAMWDALDDLRDGFPARWMLWEAEPLPATAQRLLERGVRSAVYAPLASAPPQGDFLSVMAANAERLEEIQGSAGTDRPTPGR